jgi:hypothetical protein
MSSLALCRLPLSFPWTHPIPLIGLLISRLHPSCQVVCSRHAPSICHCASIAHSLSHPSSSLFDPFSVKYPVQDFTQATTVPPQVPRFKSLGSKVSRCPGPQGKLSKVAIFQALPGSFHPCLFGSQFSSPNARFIKVSSCIKTGGHRCLPGVDQYGACW